jgi:K+-transporting ATPase ATPase C chain
MFVRLIRPAVSLLVLMTLLLGIGYPLLITGVATVAFPRQAEGSLIYTDGKLIGSTLIGQSFSDPKYFWGRPSATSPQPYNGLASSGSNLGPLNPALLDAVKANVKALHDADPDNRQPLRRAVSTRKLAPRLRVIRPLGWLARAICRARSSRH